MRAGFLFLLVCLSAVLPASASLAQSYDNPKALVAAIYEPFQRGEKPTEFGQFYSERLKGLFANQGEKTAASAGIVVNTQTSGAPEVMFNPFIDAQNYLLFDLAIGEPVIIGDNAMVTVSYHNFDHPTLLTIAAVKQADGWKVDDVASIGNEEHWLLSWLLTYDVFSN
jgi:hypothetical protein